LKDVLFLTDRKQLSLFRLENKFALEPGWLGAGSQITPDIGNY
jgi:hypothetical protein